MCQSSKCACPLCGGLFVPDDGLTAIEHLAKGVLAVFKEIQSIEEHSDYADSSLPCPRCGIYRMLPKISRNALSRHADIHVCSICGTDEAVRAFSDSVLPIADWWIVREVSTGISREF